MAVGVAAAASYHIGARPPSLKMGAMSLQAIAIRFYLRYWYKRRQNPKASLRALRAGMNHLTGRMPKPPASVVITQVNAGGVPAEWVIAPGADPGRAIIYLHGGAYASGSVAGYRDLTWRISAASRCRVLAVDYRLAPEHPCPAALEDTAAAYRYLLAAGFAPETVGFVGDSAGGGLVFAALLKLRDDGEPMPAAACTFSAWTDLAMTGRTTETNRDADPMIRAEVIRPTADWYLGSMPATSPLASPLYADLHGLPPALLQVGSTEVLLDDSRRFAEKMAAAGGIVDLRIWPDMPHAWQLFAAFLPESRAAIAEAGRFLDGRVRGAGRAEAA